MNSAPQQPPSGQPAIRSLRALVKRLVYRHTDRWPEGSRLILVHDIATWVINWEMRELSALAHRLHIRTVHPRWRGFCRNQSVFLGSQFFLFADSWIHSPHRLAVAYFHGKPNSGEPEFDQLYSRLCAHHSRFSRVQVSHSEMEQVVLESGIDPAKVFRIPIGVNLSFFTPQTRDSRERARERLGIPQYAVVVGSFQKDGVGWGDGNDPKRIKGPDVFLRAMEILHAKIPELYVLLSGPARGYVKAGLQKLGIPFKHCYVKAYPQIAELYHALDLYLVTSRQEGGPKAVLESMACGVPLVTTRVGQAMDLVRHGKNAWMVDIDDAEALAHWAGRVLAQPLESITVLSEARRTAEQNDYLHQTELWRKFFDGFVGMGRSRE